ncbi:MAG: DNA polymerase III subunit gamma/tau [Pseudomonadota bacterium]
MSYQVLARKWRPRQFSELVGQSHVVKVLTNSLNEDRVHHAFLFTGTRGVGKTTIARILAKSLNCLEGVSADPCGECEHCVAIDEGRFVDLLEIDAASRTKVDDTREILDNVQYAPARGRYKVYLIDEVHMLSTHSFNALLKTLEEPPDHVKFVLATTDPQKIPVTILSRCLQFNLRRLSPSEIGEQMKTILDSESVEAEPEALALLARAADGSMRDGLSLLDQALAGGGSLKEAAVRDMLGSVEQRHVHELLGAVSQRDGAAAMAVINEVFAQARDLSVLLQDLAEALHRTALIQQLPDYRDDSRSDWEVLVQLAGQFDPEDVQLYYQIAITGRRDLMLAPTERSGCEMTVLRMLAFQPSDAAGSGSSHSTTTAASPAAGAGGVSVNVKARASAAQTQPAEPPLAQPYAEPDPPPTASHVSEPDPPPVQASGEITPENWADVLGKLKLNGSVRMVAGLLVVHRVEESVVHFHAASDDMLLVTDRFRAALAMALEQWTGGSLRLTITAAEDALTDTPAQIEQTAADQVQAEAEAAIDGDPLVRRLCERFDAEILRESIRPNDTRSH